MTTVHSNRSGQPSGVNGTGSTGEGSGSAAGAILNPSDTFAHRHLGPDDADVQAMLEAIGCSSLEQLIHQTVPSGIRMKGALNLAGLGGAAGAMGREKGEFELLAELKAIASQNQVFRSMIGMGYSDCITPGVILRNIMENPGWYTQYTPYQAEISQGRLEALLNFQTMVSDLTGLPLAGASLLDEGTAAAEAMAMCFSIAGGHDATRKAFFISRDCHPQTIAVCQTRARWLGIELLHGSTTELKELLEKGWGGGGVGRKAEELCGLLLQYPTTDGRIESYEAIASAAKAKGVLVVAATDLLALTLIRPPGEWGADVAVGSAQRFGVPMGFGGPHAAFIATRSEHARKLPGRIIGVSRDAHGNVALRMAIQTREQHIRRDKATSNICTAQALLAIMASMYAVYHGPEGLRRIALRVHALAQTLRAGLEKLGHATGNGVVFDTLRVKVGAGKTVKQVLDAAVSKRTNLRDFGDGSVGISLDETTDRGALRDLFSIFGGGSEYLDGLSAPAKAEFPAEFKRQSGYLTHPVFNHAHSETEMLRYIFKLQGRDLSLAHSMIPLGSCTMKLNATTEMIPVTWPEFGRMHPFAPADQTRGYQRMFKDLESWLGEITGFAAVSLQPNAGSQGEYAGLAVIRAYHEHKGQSHRDVCLIPESAHGTNPASAVIAGMRVVPVANHADGTINFDDLEAKVAEHKANLGALMVTYPSTYGVFEERICEICTLVHDAGGLVYMDGANMNAQVGLTSPGLIGADVCHLNLHKTFCIPHGGGGPGMGPIGVTKDLAPFLPGHPVSTPHFEGPTGSHAIGPVSAAPYGSPSILTISWVYIALMGAEGLKKATEVAILNANYMARRLGKHYDVLFKGAEGRVAHEFVLDARDFDKSAGIKSEDIAKRLMDYGFHAPTMSWPVPNTLMIEPTESESKAELDRFCEAMIAIRSEVRAIEEGRADKADNVLKNAPHTSGAVCADQWAHPYSRTQAAFPLPWIAGHKFWPSVGRIDNPYGDRNLVCTCPPMSAYGV